MQRTPTQLNHSHDSVNAPSAVVIDDDPTSRLVAQWLLHRQGYRVSSYKGVHQDIESIASLAPDKPDVIIIDFLLQDGSAIDFIEQLNCIEGFNEIPKIVITSKRTNEFERLALAHGVADFITKPLTTSKFVERVGLTSLDKPLKDFNSQGWLPAINPLEVHPTDLPPSYSVIIVEQKNFDESARNYGASAAHQLMNELAQSLNLLFTPNHIFMSRISLSQVAVVTTVTDNNELMRVLDRLELLYQQKQKSTSSRVMPALACGVATNLGKVTFNESLRSAMFALFISRKKEKFEVEYFNHLAGHKSKRLDRIQQHVNYCDLKTLLRLSYQPQIQIESNQICALTAFVRLQTPSMGQISFDEITQVYGTSNQLNDIGLHLFEILFRDLRNIPKPINVSIHLPGDLLKSEQFVSNLNQLARVYNIDRNRVEIELLQSSVQNIDDYQLVNIFRLKNFGFSIVLDDFGIGCSNFNLLLSLPITKVKLAKIFLNPEYFEHRGERLMKSIASSASCEGFTVVIKNIETKNQLERIKVLPNILVQGLGGSPKPLEELLVHLNQQSLLNEFPEG